MAVIVERTLRHRKVGDASSPKLNYLKRKARTSRLYDIKRLSQEIEDVCRGRGACDESYRA